MALPGIEDPLRFARVELWREKVSLLNPVKGEPALAYSISVFSPKTSYVQTGRRQLAIQLQPQVHFMAAKTLQSSAN